MLSKKGSTFLWNQLKVGLEYVPAYHATFSAIISILAGAGVLFLLFKLIHQTPIIHLLNTGPRLRMNDIGLGLIIGAFVYLAGEGVNMFFSDVNGIGTNDNVLSIFGGFSIGVLVGIINVLSMLFSISYLCIALVKWTRRAWLAIPLAWLFFQMRNLFSLVDSGDWGHLPFLLIDFLPFAIFIIWAIMHDGFELMVGYMLGKSLSFNGILKTEFPFDSWSSPLFLVEFQNEGLQNWQIDLVEVAGLILCSLVLSRIYNWQNWRK